MRAIVQRESTSTWSAKGRVRKYLLGLWRAQSCGSARKAV
ncbi:hypothetical protein BMF35_a1795 [Aurantiacibacter gangjinensis]|nr:hypothetical protein BMF35_a1795 [Aurantiacibacter gangjinensis]